MTPANATTPPIGPIGGASAVNWDALEAAITAQFPNHRILSGFLVDDAGSPGGLAYFDLVTIGNATLETWEDIDDD